MASDPELLSIQQTANDFAVTAFKHASSIDDSVFRDCYLESVLMVPSLIAEASLRVNVVERCKSLETARMMIARVMTQNEIGVRSGLLDKSIAEFDARSAEQISVDIRKHSIRIRNEYSDRRGKNP